MGVGDAHSYFGSDLKELCCLSSLVEQKSVAIEAAGVMHSVLRKYIGKDGERARQFALHLANPGECE